MIGISIRIVLIVLWTLTFGTAIAWLVGIDIGLDHEPVTVVLALVSGGLTAVVGHYSIELKSTKEDLETERFSTPVALAYGYVQNFLEPAIRELLKRADPSEAPLIFYVYIPERLEELYPDSREMTLLRIRQGGFTDSVLTLDFEKGRARDLLTIKRVNSETPIYFDFPNTLLTLSPLIDYKVESRQDTFSNKEKEEVGRSYIDRFKAFVEERLEALAIRQYVKFTGKTLGLLDSGTKPDPAEPLSE